MKDAKFRLQIPKGSESFSFHEAISHQENIQRLTQLFYCWQYLPVETPLYDFFDLYKALLGEEMSHTIRFVDRHGDILMLRNDITLFLAKQLALQLKSMETPLRVSYNGKVVRYEDKNILSQHEFFQTGVELIGKSGIEADLEILVLLDDSLKSITENSKIHLGLRSLLSQTNLNKKDQQKAAELLLNRQFEKLYNLYPELKQKYGDFLDKIFTLNEFCEYFENNENKPIEALKYLYQISSKLRTMNRNDVFLIDFSEVGAKDYYTGIAFRAYLEGVGSAIATGGRYDDLYTHFHLNEPSIGFSIYLRKIESATAIIENSDSEQWTEASFSQRYVNISTTLKRLQND